MIARRTHVRAALAGLALGFSLAGTGCSNERAVTPEPVVAVQVATVLRKTIQRIVTADGVLYPLLQATIVPKISAPIEKFYVNRGSSVRAGQLLAVLENKDLTAAVEEAKGAYEQAQATYATSTKVDLPAQIQAAQLNVKATERAMQADRLVYESRLKLYKAGAMARNLMNESDVAYVQALNQYQIAEAHLKALQAVGKGELMKSAEGQLAAAKGKYLAAQAQLHYSEIRSPITGVVTDRPLEEGQLATAGTPLMTVMDISRVVARAYVSPKEASLLTVGDPASISLGGGQADVPGKVIVVSPALDPESTTVQVWAEAANPADRLKPGSTVQVNVVAETVDNSLVLPASAVLTDSSGATSVMVVVPDQKAHATDVKIGIRQGNEVQITSGLQAGELVVAQGAYGLPDGTKVKFQTP